MIEDSIGIIYILIAGHNSRSQIARDRNRGPQMRSRRIIFALRDSGRKRISQEISRNRSVAGIRRGKEVARSSVIKYFLIPNV